MKQTSALILLLLCVLLLSACGASPGNNPDDGGSSAAGAADGSASLVIDASALTQEPAFVDWTQGGTAMQLIARKDAGGEVRLAFNTCQSCGGSPYAWFEYLGNGTLQCQNCGLIFPLESVGATGAVGCNPVTITEFSLNGDRVIVPETVLADNVYRFANWKKIEP